MNACLLVLSPRQQERHHREWSPPPHPAPSPSTDGSGAPASLRALSSDDHAEKQGRIIISLKKCDETGETRGHRYRHVRDAHPDNLDLALTQGREGALALTQGRDGALSLTQGRDGALSLTQRREGALDLTQGREGALALTHGREGALALTQGREGALALTQGREGALALTQGREGALALTQGREGALALTQGREGALALTQRPTGNNLTCFTCKGLEECEKPKETACGPDEVSCKYEFTPEGKHKMGACNTDTAKEPYCTDHKDKDMGHDYIEAAHKECVCPTKALCNSSGTLACSWMAFVFIILLTVVFQSLSQSA
ncbi:unnamed protein product [Cyprideis torosa]|uniref:Uncharacterized protein n=1 Tax=Cyprideis torosa TaxID=163714 RepID=A0A7R8ZSW1_9CRUS|nr:unnamed protein product [Cyprideis torosa]CAG0896492.1 unnamed protein product [Cyprideis torosa]